MVTYAREMSTPTFAPETPLPGPPDPWASTSQPSRRDRPPYHMTDMIDAEPSLAERIVARLADPGSSAGELARAVTAATRAGEPVVVTGCGTSEHAAQAVAAILGDGADSAQAFELSLRPPSRGLVLGVSHEGATTATNAALSAARSAGARTALITVSGRSPGATLADIVVETEELDQGWCHTVGYVSPIVAAAVVAAHIAGERVDASFGAAIRGCMAAGQSRSSEAEWIARALADAREILVIASGSDRPAGRELVLKIEEGAWMRAAYRDLESFLHGHLAATDDHTGLVLILTDRDARAGRVARARAALAAARVIGIRSAAIVADGVRADLAADLTPGGRIVVPDAPALAAPVAAILGSAIPLQLLTERLARVRGVDPDPIHRDVEAYRRAAEVAEG